MEEKIAIGKIINTRGLKGDLKVQVFEVEDDKFSRDIPYYIEINKNEYIPVEVKKSSFYNKFFYISLKEHEDINLVEKFKNKYIYIDEKDLKELDKHVYYAKDLLDLEVYDEHNKLIGNVEDVYTEYPNVVLKVKDLYIPMVHDYIEEINLDKGLIRIIKENLE